MNKTIRELILIESKLKREIKGTESLLYIEYAVLFDNLALVKELLSNIEKSNDYIIGLFGEPSLVVESSDFLKRFDDHSKPYLLTYLEGYHYIYYDDINKYFELPLGPSIIIHNDGFVYDNEADKIVLKDTDYNNIKDRNDLINKYQENLGVFNGVFESDYYGNIKMINTLNQG